MKKILSLIVIAIFAITSVNAQNGISFGIRAIPTFNWVTLSDTVSTHKYENEGTKMGIGFGPSLRYKFSDNFNVDVSGIFTWQKFGIKVLNELPANPEKVDITEKFKVQFLQIPLNLNGQFEVADDLNALLNFGVGAGIKLKSSRLVEDPDRPNHFSEEYDSSIKMLTFVDFYLTAGAGVVYDIEDNLHLSLTVQYNNGIINGWLDNKNKYKEENDSNGIKQLNLKHKNVALSIGFYIDL